MQEQILSIQNSIIGKDDFQGYQCQICYSIALKPVECIGPCSKKFCSKCVSDWKIMQDKCPLKCSQPFFVKGASPPSVRFKCPYNPQTCQIDIPTVLEFQEHFEVCQYISEHQKWLEDLKKNCKCFKQHDLQFFLGTYEEMCGSKCNSCKQVRLCRSICRKCNQLYCVFCRPPLSSKKSCPLGHILNYQKWNQIGYICDLCGISTSISNGGVYDDALCNFGLCQQCYQSLPDTCMKQKIKISPYKCNQNHQLKIQLPQQSIKMCRNCDKQKLCPKICVICQQSYCIECKIGIITEAKLCIQGHQLIHYVELQGQNQKVCLKCQSVKKEYYEDRQCNFVLCVACFDYENQIFDNKNRFVEQVACKKGHQLKFYSGKTQCISQCTNCRRTCSIRLYCDYCNPGDRAYCCLCRPLERNKFCYFGHQLKDWKSQEQFNCNKCQNNNNQFKRCFNCNYFICSQCFKSQ